MVQFLYYVSLWLAIGGVIGCIGIFTLRAIEITIGRLDARILILKGEYDIDKVNADFAKAKKDFVEKSWQWWMLWYADIVILWPKSLFLFGEQLVNDIKTYAELKKKLKSMES